MSADPIHPAALLRLAQVLKIIPIGRTTWLDGVRDGRFPAPVRLGPRTIAWRAADILAIAERGVAAESEGAR